MLPVTTSPRAGHPPDTAIQRKCSRDNMMFIENLQGATASAEESLVCVILIFSVKDLTGLQTWGPSFLIGCTSACGSGGKFPKTSKFVLELTIPCLPSLDYGPRSFQKIQDEEFGAFIFSSITVHNVYHEGEALREMWWKHVVCRSACDCSRGTGGRVRCGKGFDKIASVKTGREFCS